MALVHCHFFSQVLGQMTALISLTLIMIIANSVVAFASDFNLLLFGRVLLGISIGGFWATAIALSGRLAPKGIVLKPDGESVGTRPARPLKDEIIYEGKIQTLRRFQNEASEVREGQECGIVLDRFANFAEGDIIESYEIEKVAQEL